MPAIRRFRPRDLSGVLRLCVAEGWDSLAQDPDRALRALTAPGVTTVVAIDGSSVVGFAELLSDGAIQAYLALIAVDQTQRRQGLGRRLVSEALRMAGGERIDLLSEESATPFYRSLPHVEKPGIRLYPFHDPAGQGPSR